MTPREERITSLSAHVRDLLAKRNVLPADAWVPALHDGERLEQTGDDITTAQAREALDHEVTAAVRELIALKGAPETPYERYLAIRAESHEWYIAVRGLVTEATRRGWSSMVFTGRGPYRSAELDPNALVLRTNVQMFLQQITAFEYLCKDWDSEVFRPNADAGAEPKVPVCAEHAGKFPERGYGQDPAKPGSIRRYFEQGLGLAWPSEPDLNQRLPQYWKLRDLWVHRAGYIDGNFKASAPLVWAKLKAYLDGRGGEPPAPDTRRAWISTEILAEMQGSIELIADWIAKELDRVYGPRGVLP